MDIEKTIDKQDFVESLIEFVIRASKENATPEELKALPEVAKVLSVIFYQ